MKIIQFGAPDLGLKCLDQLVAAGFPPEFVVPTQRGHLAREPMINAAHEHDIPVILFDRSPTEEHFVNRIRTLAPDLIVVSAYPHLIPEEIFTSAKTAAINVHPSLLPEYQGANPYYHVIANGEPEAGVSLHLLDQGFDTGAIISQTRLPLHPKETMGTLVSKIDSLGAEELVSLVKRISTTGIPKSTQQQANAKHKANKVQSWNIDWSLDADQIDRRVRALNPFLEARTRLHQTDVVIYSGCPSPGAELGVPGEVVSIEDQAIGISVGDGRYRITALKYGREWIGDAMGLVSHGLIQVGDIFSSPWE